MIIVFVIVSFFSELALIEISSRSMISMSDVHCSDHDIASCNYPLSLFQRCWP